MQIVYWKSYVGRTYKLGGIYSYIISFFYKIINFIATFYIVLDAQREQFLSLPVRLFHPGYVDEFKKFLHGSENLGH